MSPPSTISGAPEASPDRDAHPLLDLFLDSLRRSRHELLAGRVEQEDRGGADAHELAHAQQRFLEQSIDLAREGQIAQRHEVTHLFGSGAHRLVQFERDLAAAKPSRPPAALDVGLSAVTAVSPIARLTAESETM